MLSPSPDADAVHSTDLATTCMMDPGSVLCEEVHAEDATADVRFAWVVSTIPKAECSASVDSVSFCGDANAVVTYELVCQKQAVSVNGALQVCAHMCSCNCMHDQIC